MRVTLGAFWSDLGVTLGLPLAYEGDFVGTWGAFLAHEGDFGSAFVSLCGNFWHAR